jgi:hypothetical protein
MCCLGCNEPDLENTMCLFVGWVGGCTDQALALVKRLHECERIAFEGIYTHGGHGYGGATRAQIEQVAAEERQVMHWYDVLDT